jgi:hypothetical protein
MEIRMPGSAFCGYVYYRSGPWGEDIPVQDARVQIIDLDEGGNGDDLLWEGLTDSQGCYSGVSAEWVDENMMKVGDIPIPTIDRPQFRVRVRQGDHDTGLLILNHLGDLPAVIVIWAPPGTTGG